MDKVTQIQLSLEQLSLLFVSSIDSINKSSGFKQVDSHYPITQKNVLTDSSKTSKDHVDEYSTQILEVSKKIDSLIDSLPELELSKDIQTEVNNKERQLRTLQRDLDDEVLKAKKFSDEISGLFNKVTEV
ncbi:hypothetical protein BB560_006556 [Smittium megazygosporum]|uniref:Mediator of RNA polymerase II transcription subunit 21 n=1 Tax=Smittium megazygosporum TaxID=133381 RepID=A0A2T9Y3Y0_9FUNG|nr:hypothetical protein BB560_006556 [Smittium megazygosporum]